MKQLIPIAGLSLVFTFPCCLAQAQPLPAAPAGGVARAVADDEIRPRTLAGKNGSILVEVMASAQSVIREIHSERGAYYAQIGRSPDAMARSDASMRSRDRESSLFLRMNDGAALLGLLEQTGDPYQPVKIMAADFNDGTTVRIVFSGAKLRGRRALGVAAYDSAGRLHSFSFVTAFEARVITLE